MTTLTQTATFRELFNARGAEGKFVCVGLDPKYSDIPAEVPGENFDERLVNFICPVIESTADIAAMFKPNLKFYLRKGWRGIKALEEICRFARLKAPDVVLTLDLKDGDIGETNLGGLEFARDLCKVHAVTLHNYMGRTAMAPYLDSGLFSFVLVRTSNPGADEFQRLPVAEDTGLELGPHPLFCSVAWNLAHEWGDNVGAVAGASPDSIEDLAAVRELMGDKPILCPGVGKQGGKAAEAYQLGCDEDGGNIAINSSGGITHAHIEEEYAGLHWAEASAKAAHKLDDEITRVREEAHAAGV